MQAWSWTPWTQWLPLLSEKKNRRADLMAGLTGAIVVLPQGIAFATLAGMPPQYGLYTAMLPCLIAAFFGSSRTMVTGPANAISLTTAALLLPLAAAGSARYVELAITLSFLVALLQLGVAFSGLAKWVDRVPHSVILGFTAGAAILIINAQVGAFLGLELKRGLPFWETAAAVQSAFKTIHWPSAFVGMATLVTCVLAKRWPSPVPYMLSAVFVGVLVYLLGRAADPALFSLKTVERLPNSLPPLSAPTLSAELIQQLALPALVMTLLAITESLSIAKSFAIRKGQSWNAKQEIFGQGLANVAGAFTSSYPAAGSFNRSGLNYESGAITPFAAICAALLLVVFVFFLAPLARFLPLAVIAGLLFMVAWGLIDFAYPRHTWFESKLEFFTWLTTFVLTVTVSLEWAIIGGLLCYLVLGKTVLRTGAE